MVDCLVEPKDRPWYLSDRATVFDISLEMPEEIVRTIEAAYTIELSREQLSMPLWQLLNTLGP